MRQINSINRFIVNCIYGTTMYFIAESPFFFLHRLKRLKKFRSSFLISSLVNLLRYVSVINKFPCLKLALINLDNFLLAIFKFRSFFPQKSEVHFALCYIFFQWVLESNTPHTRIRLLPICVFYILALLYPFLLITIALMLISLSRS